MNKRGSQYPTMEIGQVVSPSPLTVKIRDLQIGSEDIYVADYLLADYTREFTFPPTSVNGQTNSADGHTHSLNTVGVVKEDITFLDTVELGDLLAVYPISDNQKYVILARLVKI